MSRITDTTRPLHILIIGNGIAGITAARTIRKKSSHRITVISDESTHFFSRTALMYVYMGHMRWKDIHPYAPWFWKKNRIELLHDRVTAIGHREKRLHLASGREVVYDKLIVATGSASNQLNVPGCDLEGISCLYAKQDLEYIEGQSAGIRRAVIVGGGLIGVELAEMFHRRGIEVIYLVRENSFSDMVLPAEESGIVNRHIREHGIDLRLGTELRAIHDHGTGRVHSVETSKDEIIDCQFVAVAIGVHPNVAWMGTSDLEIRDGILVDEWLQTSLPDVYAAGDCAEVRQPDLWRKPVEPFWYTGRIMGEVAGLNACGIPTPYDAGIWFNSAKFFDIEYQVYGQIHPLLPEGHASLYWEHTDGKKSIRIQYTPEGILGFNLMGVRFRQEVCENWIRNRKSIEEVLAGLEHAWFDPEFSSNPCHGVRETYKAKTGITITPFSKNKSLISFVKLKKTMAP